MSFSEDQAAYGLRDVKVSPMTDDPVNGSPTYGAAVDCPFIQDLSYSLQMQEIELMGDDKKITKSKVIGIEGQFKVGKRNAAMMATILGGSDSGTTGVTPNRTRSYEFAEDDNIPYFKIEGQAMDFEAGTAGDEHVEIHKCIITANEQSYSQENPRETTYSFKAMFRDSDGKLLKVTRNETAVAIPAGAVDTTPPTVAVATPADAATGVSVSVAPSVEFNEALDPRTVNGMTVYLQSKATGALISGVVSLTNSNKTVVFTPAANLSAATQYQLAITQGVRNLAHLPAASHILIDFQTA